MSKITFVILTYFPDAKKIFALLESLEPNQVVLVDNTPDKSNSFENILQQGAKMPKHVHLISNGKNLGYTGGVNSGLKYASTIDSNWVVVLNDDLVLNKTIIRDFIKQLEITIPGVAGPFERYLDEMRWTTRISRDQQRDYSALNRYISGSFFAIHKKVLEKIGLLHLPYFIFYEEVEYCVRARNNGFKLTHIALPPIGHKESSSFTGKNFLHQYYLARNHLLFVERNAPMRVKLYELVRFPKTLWEHLIRKEWGSLFGISDYIFRRFGPHKNSL